jgi:hypothetical protein
MTRQPDEADTTSTPAAGPPSRRRRGQLVAIVVAGCVAVVVLVLLDRTEDGETTVPAPLPSATAAPSSSESVANPSAENESDSPGSSGAGDNASNPVTTGSPTPRIQGSDDLANVDLETSAPISAVSTLPPDPVDPPDDAAAASAIDDLLAETVVAINPPSSGTPGLLPDLRRIATGAILEELEATRAEFEAMEWTQTGTPAIVDLRVITPPSDAAPADAVVEVCLDNSGVRILDSAGNDVRTPGTPARSLNIYTLRWTDDRWLVAGHTFADDADC